MDSRDRSEHGEKKTNNNICELEWIAWAMDAARQYREEHAFATRDSFDASDDEEDDED